MQMDGRDAFSHIEIVQNILISYFFDLAMLMIC